MIHPVSLIRLGASFLVGAAAEIVCDTEDLLAELVARPLSRIRTGLEHVATALDPGEEYVPLVKPYLDSCWRDDDFQAASAIIARALREEGPQ